MIVKSAAPLFLFWLAITGTVDPTSLTEGVVLSASAGYLVARTLWSDDAPILSARQTWRLLCYMPRLVFSIVRSAMHVARLVFDPALPVFPTMVRHRVPFRRDVSAVAYANSVTMTPGTLTVDIVDDEYVIHCLDQDFAAEVRQGDLERQIADVFD